MSSDNPNGVDSQDKRLALESAYLPRINCALHQNGIPVFNGALIDNSTERSWQKPRILIRSPPPSFLSRSNSISTASPPKANTAWT